jgi:type IV pilus assembly protein PilV
MMRRHQQGFSFIEVMIAFFILATGLIGTVAMQAVAKRNSYDATQRAQALAMANDVIDRIRANSSVAASYNGNDYGAGNIVAPAPRCNAAGANCTAAEIALNDRFEWDQRLLGTDVISAGNNAGGIVGATGCVRFDAIGDLRVVISWLGREEIRDAALATGEAGCGDASADRRQVVVDTFIWREE